MAGKYTRRKNDKKSKRNVVKVTKKMLMDLVNKLMTKKNKSRKNKPRKNKKNKKQRGG